MRLSILFLLGIAAWGQEARQINLNEAVQTALDQHPGVAAARKRLVEADHRIRQAKAEYYPKVGVSGIAKAGLSGATNALGLVGLPNSPFFSNFAVALNVYQPIYDGGRTKFRIAYEKRRREVLVADLEAVEAQVKLRTELAYYALLRNQKSKEVAAEILGSREMTARQARAFFNAGLRSRVDLDLAEVNFSQARLRLLTAENETSVATATLARSIGAPQHLPYVPENPQIELPRLGPLEDLIRQAMELRPEMHALKAEQAATMEQIRIAKAESKPLIALVFSGGYARFSEYLLQNLMSGGAGLIWPLFAGGKYKAQMQEGEAHLDTLQSIEEDFKQGIALEVRRAYAKLQTTIQSLSTYQLRAEASRRAVRIARERYRQRLGTVVELNQAQASQAEAAMGEATGLYDVAVAEAELRFVAGLRQGEFGKQAEPPK